MADHFSAVGFPARNLEEMQEVLKVAFDRADESGASVEHADGRTCRYEDPSGATLTIHVDRRGGFECCQPGFAGPSRSRWRPLQVVPDPDGCRFCDLVYAQLLDDEDEELYPFAVRIETMAVSRELIPYGDPGEVGFVGLWEEGRVWPDEATFARHQEAEWADVSPPPEVSELLPQVRGFASRSVIPSGTFAFEDGAPVTPHVLAHGIVQTVEERHNQLRNAPFRLVRLDTLGGTFDTCVAPGILEHEELLVPGAVAGGTLWLVGRPLTLRDAPGPVPTAEEKPRSGGLLGRFFGRR